jgi:probable rRNA maturation factor
MLKIYINNEQDKIPVSEEEIENLVKTIFKAGELEEYGEISVTLTDDEQMAQLNREYRDIDGTTDVLAFAQDEGMEMPKPSDPDYTPLIGDIIISVPTALKQAEEAKHPLNMELTILLIHGILHLFGYDHDNIYQQAFMKEEEKAILQTVLEGNLTC